MKIFQIDHTDNTAREDARSRVWRVRWKRVLAGIGVLAGICVLVFAGIVWYLIAEASDIDSITVSPVESATYICDEDGNFTRKLTLASSNRDIVSLEDIPLVLQQAIIAIEDERFYEHNGIDVKGIGRAFWIGVTTGSFSEGASTITQQLIKNNVFTEWTQENSFWDRFSRKVQEQYLALQLEKRISKEEILEDYLNTINLGSGCYGVQSASLRYFGKDVSELTLSEAAVLSAIPQNPTGYNPITAPTANAGRRETILQYMYEQGYISGQEKSDALSDDVYSRIRAYNETYEEATVYSYYEDALIDQVISLLTEEKNYSPEQAYRAVYSGGLRIYSAQDSKLQQICEEEFQNPDNYPENTSFGVDYALSIADAYGEVTHYSSGDLQNYIRQNVDSDFNLMCDSKEDAQTYVDKFREYLLTTEYDETASILGERLTLSPQPQASLVLIDQSEGYVKAIVGGRGEKTASLTLNRASSTTRQPGSTFKILTTYAPALDSGGQTLATTYRNEPYQYQNGTTVSNWDVNDYSGIVTIREAITRSINVVAVKCITAITPQLGFDYAEKFGISTLVDSETTENGTVSDIIQPLALGGITNGVTNLELCNAYAAIANGGIYHAPRFFTKVLDRYGEVLLDSSCISDEGDGHKSGHTEEANSVLTDSKRTDDDQAGLRTHTRVLSEGSAFLLTDAMRDVVSDASGTAYGAISASGQIVAGKTGTTSDYRDIWFVGYTPYYTCCVWGGYDNNDPLPLVSTCHTYNRVLWSAVMDRVHQDLQTASFDQPDSVISVTLCSESHLLPAGDGCPSTYKEYFIAGTQPEEECTIHEPETETETEPVLILEDILDELESESESGFESELESGSESESESESETKSETESQIIPESGSEAESESSSSTKAVSETDTGTEKADPSDINSLEDLMNRLSIAS